MTQGFDFKNLDANNISDSFLQQLKQNKQHKIDEPFDKMYQEALENEEKKQVKPENATEQTKQVETQDEKQQSESVERKESSSDDSHSQSDEQAQSKEEFKAFTQLNFLQVNAALTATFPKDIRQLMSQIVEVVQANADTDAYEFKAKQVDVNIKFQKESDAQLKITIVLGDTDIQQQLNKSLVDDMQNHLRMIFNYDEIELVIVDQADALLFESSSDQQQQQDEQTSSDDQDEDALNDETN